MKEIKLYLNYAGHCFASAHHVVKGDENKMIKFHALFGLLNHPEKGWILFDTGYTTRFYNATKNYPNKIYANATKVVISDINEIKNQLKSLGLETSDIKHIIISHFHADHIGGLKDFNHATMYCTKKSYQQVKQVSNFFAFSKGILKQLIPEDIEDRLVFIEECSTENSDDTFGVRYDLFQDNSVIIYNLPGHAAGQIGIVVKTQKKKYFLVADSCWDERAYKEGKLPNSIVRLFFDSWKDYKDSLQKVTDYHNKNPEVIIVPTHCSTTTDSLVSNKIDMDVL
ncbi:MAG: MBL fold metallo-hydrolase [Crocinitomicaceae bacterium]|nr:MBL fold metallo-hydrolase [Crocinitomicaceae bacterium]